MGRQRSSGFERENSGLVDSLASLQNTPNIVEEIQSFICRAYLYVTKKGASYVHQRHDLGETRYVLFTRSKLESEKLPPTLGSFMNHFLRAYFQLNIWNSASMSIIPDFNPEEYGWYIDDNERCYMANTTSDDITPKSIIELISCKGNCSTAKCGCRKNKIACTDFCGCSTTCENIDPPLPESFNIDFDDEI